MEDRFLIPPRSSGEVSVVERITIHPEPAGVALGALVAIGVMTTVTR